MSILDDLNAVYNKLRPTIWYIVGDHVPSGQVLQIKATDFFPEVWHIHPDDWAEAHRKLTDLGYRLRDFRSWRPEGAPAPTVIEGEGIGQ